uniref:Uncharacterized protein n=1 Tax=Cannabis sativa TaxID=3483 RepID=A0A803P9F2_CANSA
MPQLLEALGTILEEEPVDEKNLPVDAKGNRRRGIPSSIQESASVNVDGFSAWSWSHISSGAPPPFENLLRESNCEDWDCTLPADFFIVQTFSQVDAISSVELLTRRSKEIAQKKGQYRAFSEEQLKVEGLVTTELLRRSGLITRFQSIDTVSLQG